MARKTKDGKWIDGSGEAIPVKYISPIDKKRDKVVTKLCKDAEKLSEALKNFKEKAMKCVEDYLDYVADKNGISIKTKKGNKVLFDFSRDYKVELRVAEHIDFDERLQLARELIGECIKKWAKNSDDKIKILVEDAFRVDKKGRIDRNRILGLTKLEIRDKEWQKAMKLIKDSIQVIGRKPYIRFWKKSGDDFEVIPLDIAGI